MQATPSHNAAGEPFLPPLSPSASSAGIPPFTPPLRSWAEPTARVLLPLAVNEGEWIYDRTIPSSPSSPSAVAEGIGLAHDAGNLLGAIRLYCDLLALPGVLRTEHRHYAEELRHLSARSGSLIDRMLRPAQTADSCTEETSGAVGRAVGERVLPVEVALACRGLLQTIAGVGPFLLAFEAGIEDRAVFVPREALERILVNLTKNAAEARSLDQGHGAITVRVRTVPEWKASRAGGVALSVEDCGRGMTEAALCRLLADEVTGRCPPSPPRDESRPSRGIGFRVVRELVAATGGELSIRSRVGQGTTVEMIWAACGEDAERSG